MDLNNKKTPEELYFEVLEFIRKRHADLSDDELYKFHQMLKAWCNKLI